MSAPLNRCFFPAKKMWPWKKIIKNRPAAHGPVCIPMRSLRVSSGRWRIVKRDTWSRRSRAILQIFPSTTCAAWCEIKVRFRSSNQPNAILQISAMCLPSLGFGNPLTTTYASPIVSTCNKWFIRYDRQKIRRRPIVITAGLDEWCPGMTSTRMYTALSVASHVGYRLVCIRIYVQTKLRKYRFTDSVITDDCMFNVRQRSYCNVTTSVS